MNSFMLLILPEFYGLSFFFLSVLFCVYYLLLCNKLPPKYRDLIQLSFVLCHLFSVYQEFKNKVAC